MQRGGGPSARLSRRKRRAEETSVNALEGGKILGSLRRDALREREEP